jgi:hypothetical protein
VKKCRFLGLVLLCFGLFVPALSAQPASPSPASSEGWRFKVVPYLWGSDFKGTLGIGNRSADVDASFLDILRELNFAFMGTVEAGRDRFVSAANLDYLDLSDKHATPGPLFSGVNAVQKSFLLGSVAGYRVVGSDAAFLDVLGGIRFWHIKGELDFHPGVLPGFNLDGSRDWVDGIFGLRGKAHLSSSWYVTGYGDIGGGGSNLTYQLLGIAGKDFGDKYALVLGYRYLNVDYNKDRFLFDTGMGGPVIGWAFKF